MRIAVLSGKGGTGKTFVSVNLAAAADESVYADCDVEEPDGHLFFKPENLNTHPVVSRIPVAIDEKCTGCRKCMDFCAWHALAVIGKKILVFEEMCHSCGGCSIICPEKAITEREEEVGTVSEGFSGTVHFFSGCLKTGKVSGIPVIKSLLRQLPADVPVIIDCPPGSACSVMESIRSVDYCLLVAEPTRFGMANLETVYKLALQFGKKCGVVINKNIRGRNPATVFCRRHHIPVIARIDFDPSVAHLNSEGTVISRQYDSYRILFRNILAECLRSVKQ